MLELLVVLCLSALSAGVFLRMKLNTMLLAVAVGAVAETVAFLLGRSVIPSYACAGVGLICAAVCMVVAEKRPFDDGLMAVCVGGCQIGLWTTFHSGLGAVVEGDIVLFLYAVFYLLHIPAILRTFENFRLPKYWQVETKGFQNVWVPLVGLGMMFLVGAITFVETDNVWATVVQILVCTMVFWLSLAVMVLLVICGKKGEQTTAEGHYHHEMNTFMNIVRSQRHDYNLHVQTVASLIAQQKWEECCSYVNALVQDTNQMNDVLPVKDPAVASLIYSYRMMTEQRGISLVLDIRDDMSLVVTNAYETNKIVGNLLQNALDEIVSHDKPGSIELSVFKRGEYCLVRVSNPVEDPESFETHKEEIFGQGFTTKQGHDGVGLSSIRALARQYGGDVTTWLEKDTVHFVAAIPMRLTPM